MANLDPRVVIEDARHRHLAVVALINAIDAQAMRLLRLYFSLGIACAAGAVSVFFAEKIALPLPLGWALLGALVCLTGGAYLCLGVMKSTPINLPGRKADFWLWALDERVGDAEVVRAYLENLKEQNRKNDDLNAALSAKFSRAKMAAVWTPIVAAFAGGLAAIPYAALWGLWGAA